MSTPIGPTNGSTGATGGASAGLPGAGISAPTRLGTGMAANFTPASFSDLYKDPTIILAQMIAQQYGINPNDAAFSPLFSMVAPDAATAMQSLAPLALGGTKGTGDQGDIVNWVASYLKNQMTPGAYLNTGQMLGNLFNAQQGSGLYDYLHAQDPQVGASNFGALATAAATQGMAPFWAKTMQDNLNRLGVQYVEKAATDPTYAAKNAFPDFLKGNPQSMLSGYSG